MATPKQPNSSAGECQELERVKLLYDYTKFHIGVYLTLASALTAVFASPASSAWLVNRSLVATGLGFIVVAGIAGGVVASSLPYFAASTDIYEEKTGPLSSAWLSIRWWTYIEHMAFWVALGIVLMAFLLADKSKRLPSPTSSPPAAYSWPANSQMQLTSAAWPDPRGARS
jgi:hypothetical protein